MPQPSLPEPGPQARDVRRLQPDPLIDRPTFVARYRARCFDPAFEVAEAEIARLVDIAWQGYIEGRKTPRTVKAGPEFADPDYDLAVEWKATATPCSRRRRVSATRAHRAVSCWCVLRRAASTPVRASRPRPGAC